MGQSVVALMYGISNETKGLVDDEGEPFWSEYSNTGKSYEVDDGPRNAYEGGVVGYPVACGPACNNDEGYLGEDCLLADIEQKHAEYIKAAREKWNKFAAWALTEHGKELPQAALWLTTDERA